MWNPPSRRLIPAVTPRAERPYVCDTLSGAERVQGLLSRGDGDRPRARFNLLLPGF